MTDVKAELREQFMDAFGGADFPVKNQMDLVPALPNGPATKFEAGDVSFTAMELAAKLGSDQDFPYDSAEELVDDVLEALESKDLI
ncbi:MULTISPECIES: MTH865 family protein [Haloferacaceae]|uniref:MTH865 family protein n=1 Tax=Halorubrum glutamatedens TaxID=2707018 RepID=A0ABD5QQZ0_9EURY|nr:MULTISPECIES: MTH865 family protein [Haloferacales]